MDSRLFGINGLLGFFILFVVLLGVAAFLGFNALKTQRIQATNPYRLETPNKIETKSTKNIQYYKLVK